MLLRESGGIEGVAHDTLLERFVVAALGHDEDGLVETREALRSSVGDGAVVDSAAVIATFQRMNRFADATGMPLDKTIEMVSRGVRAELGIDQFANAVNTRSPGLVQRTFGPIFRPFTRLGLWWMRKP
jgi:hypothetical protein